MSEDRPYKHIARRKSRQIQVGSVPVGGDAPIAVQSMTTTATTDVQATIDQIRRLEAVGVDIVRVSCPDKESTAALAEIVKAATVPIVADIHFHFRRALEAAKAGAACLRINPGNIVNADKIAEVIQAAKDYNCSIRVGVNGGSLEPRLLEKYGYPCPEAMVESALDSIKIMEDNDFFNFKISVKASDVQMAMASYRLLAAQCDYPLHVGVTEAGGLRAGTVKSALGIGGLLSEGIGDTIRVSLSADPVEEVKVGFDILKSLGLRHYGVNVISCPSCARQNFDVIKTVAAVEQRLEHITTPMTVSILGCVVNGIGEAKESDVGFTGSAGGVHQVYVGGLPSHKLNQADEDVVEHIVKLVEEKAAQLAAELA